MYSQRKSLNFGQYVPNDKVLNKKVPENPKYKHVKPAIDTGKNVKKHIDELKEKHKVFSHKKDEVFNRVKFSTFLKLAVNVAKDSFKQTEKQVLDETLQVSDDASKKEKFEIANVLVGIGEIDLRNEKKNRKTTSNLVPVKKVPYLLLDVRDRDQYLQCHIKTAKHYPSAMLSRSIGYETDELKLYKNSNPSLIILYDDDESIASRVANTLIQRGYENIYLLTGGLKLGNEIFPRVLMNTICTSRATSGEHFTRQDVDIVLEHIGDFPQQGKYSERYCPSRMSFQKSHSSYQVRPNYVADLGCPVRTESACSYACRPVEKRPTSRPRAPWK